VLVKYSNLLPEMLGFYLGELVHHFCSLFFLTSFLIFYDLNLGCTKNEFFREIFMENSSEKSEKIKKQKNKNRSKT